MTAPTTTPAAQDYLAAVEHELADLPIDDRTELLDDLAMHLAALEEEGEERPLTARLGSPADYAAELRAAAGLPDKGTAGRRAVAERIAALRETRAVQEVVDFAPQLQPGWWVLRGYLLVAIPSLWDVNRSRDFPVPAPFNSHVIGIVLVTLAVVGSIALGRRRLPKIAVAAVIALDVLLLASAWNLLHDWRWRTSVQVAFGGAAPVDLFAESPVATTHGPVTNIFPYTTDGKPLDGVLLFDQDGRPLQTGNQLWWADQCRRIVSLPRAADGVPVPFSYPKTYVLDPAGGTLNGVPATAGQCAAALARPAVPLPTFPTPAASAVTKH
jgi:hypothetical protein